MKSFYKLLFFSVLLTCCNNDDHNAITPIDQLPLITQTGEGTFGCLVNGEPFIDNSGNFNCFYQFVNGEYFFHVTAKDLVHGIDEITIYFDKVQIEEGETYQLGNYEEFSVTGILFFENSTQNVNTNLQAPGTLTIIKLDTENQIVSGLFSFNVIHPITNNTIIVSEGRFDSFFTE